MLEILKFSKSMRSSFIFLNIKYNNSRHNAYTQVFTELCTLCSDHPKLDHLSHMKTFSFRWLFVVVFSWKFLNYNGDLTASAKSLAPTETSVEPWRFFHALCQLSVHHKIFGNHRSSMWLGNDSLDFHAYKTLHEDYTSCWIHLLIKPWLFSC